jgi:hypothetical protein
MDLLGRTVGATLSQAEFSETKTDADLTAEIAPAMLIKLREDGSARGGALWASLFSAWLVFSQVYWNEARLDPKQYSETISAFYMWAIVPIGLAALGLHFYFKRRSVTVEVRYRRQHGKWRWER